MARKRPENRLNDLTNREWLIETKSFWRALGGYPRPEGLDDELLGEFAIWLKERFGRERAAQMLGQAWPSVMTSLAPTRDTLKATHPATFSERDIERLIRLFTKSGERVLDPFVGTGSTLLACHTTGRRGVGIELVQRWWEVAAQRLEAAGVAWSDQMAGADRAQVLLRGNCLQVLSDIAPNSFQFIVTSPPYWSILNKRGGDKTAAERTAKGLPTRYSDEAEDLGNIASYEEFLARLGEAIEHCARVLAPRRYLCLIVADFRHGPRFHLYHADVARLVEERGLELKGVTILIQDNKNLYPLGIPHSFVSNIHHQYVLIFEKPRG